MKDSFDTIIIGAGLAGLSCAALLAKASKKVLVLEKNCRSGGYAVSYTKKDHRFDMAVQALGGCDPEGAVYRLLEDMDLKNSIEFLPCEPARVYFFDETNDGWQQSGFQKTLIRSLCKSFPEYAPVIKECYTQWSGILDELEKIANHPSNKVAFGFSKSFPLLSRYSGYTVKAFLDEKQIPADLQQLMTARASYCMLPPERLSLIGFACTEMSYSKGAWMVKGGVERITQVLAASIKAHGGIILCNTRAMKIQTQKDKGLEIETNNGSRYQCHTIVMASAVSPSLKEMLDDPKKIPDRFFQRIDAMEPSGSYYIAYYSVPSSTVEGLFPNMEFINQDMALFQNRAPDAWYMLIPSLVDKSATPRDRHCLCMSIPCPPGFMPGKKGRDLCRNFLETNAVRRFPRLKKNMAFLFDLGPKQLAAISGNPGGSAYGWALIPEQAGIRRLNIKTPLYGLYLAGHWTMPGGGIAGVITSGRLCAETIVKELETKAKDSRISR